MIKNSKRYAKFEVEIDTELSNLNVLSFILLIEVAISDPINPVLTRSTKNILKKFPSWMLLYKDSTDQATPDLYVPQTTAGKFINSIVGENLDNFDKELDLLKINSFIDRADENQIAWIYSSTNVNTTFHKILGNGIELARIDNLVDFFNFKQTDHVFYHNPINREILTLQTFTRLQAQNVNSGLTNLDQIPVQKFNWFDELGLRVGVNRLYLESNTSFRQRILDAFKNPIGIDIDSFKKTLRRELNLWKAFGVEPSSTYSGATPEISEMSDITSSTPYFAADGNPTDAFRNLVEELNIKYPNNWGYLEFDNAIWDYAGLNQDGVSRLAARYHDSTVNIPYYQPGVGDLNDLAFSIIDTDATPTKFETYLVAKGKKKVGSTPEYYPVDIEFEYYSDYTIKEYDNPPATVNFTLEFHATPHGVYSTPSTFYSPVVLYPKNNKGPQANSAYEWQSYNIFDTEGFTSNDLILRGKSTLQRYENSINNIAVNKIDINRIENILIKLGLWNGTDYSSVPTSDSFIIRFSNNPINSLIYGTSTPHISATPALNQSTKIELASKLWSEVTRVKQTSKQKTQAKINQLSATPPDSYLIDKNTIMNNIIYPQGATPRYFYINNIGPVDSAVIGYSTDSSSISGYGGVAFDPLLNSKVFVPSSPNILIDIQGGSATANQYFSTISYPYSATPNSISVKLTDGSVYPRASVAWEPFIATSTPISGYIDEYGFVGYSKNNGEFIPSKNTDSIIIPEITRETFGISGSSKFDYYFESISIVDPIDVNVLIWSEQKIINPFLNRSYVLQSSNIEDVLDNSLYTTKRISYPGNAIKESYDLDRNTTVFDNFIAKGRLYDARLEARVNTGWIHLDNQEYYVYARPKKEIFTGNLKEIILSSAPQQGAPIYITAIKDAESTPYADYIETAFEDLSTPRQLGFFNKEVIYPSFDNSFYLSYQDVYDADVVDTFTGETIATGLETSTHILSSQTATPIFFSEREYEITYRVRNSYHIDNIVSGSSSFSKVVFDATPGYSLNYEIVYESSQYESSTPVSINLGETSSLLDSGYIYVTSGNYGFDTAKVKISPTNIIDDGNDYMVISIIALDINGNPKPDQTFNISSQYLTISPQIITTNLEGYAIARATYAHPATPLTGTIKDYITVSGSNPENASFNKQYEYNIHSGYINKYSISTVADPAVIKADGVSSIFIDGIASVDNAPAKNAVLYWRKARTPYAAIELENYSSSTSFDGYSGIVTANQNGRFSIGPIVSQDRSTPGYWYMVVESAFEPTYAADATPLAGDISYWYESYDNIDLNYVSNLKMVDVINFNNEESLEIYSTPSFRTSYYNEQLVLPTGATPRWNPPKWLPIPRYEQYQAGFLGSTPYYISNYNNLKKDN